MGRQSQTVVGSTVFVACLSVGHGRRERVRARAGRARGVLIGELRLQGLGWRFLRRSLRKGEVPCFVASGVRLPREEGCVRSTVS